MKKYSVKVSAEAKEDLDNILSYLKYEKKNPQAVRNVFKDYVEIREALATTADFKRNPDSPKLVERGLKELPHNTAAHLAVPFPPSAACRFLDLPPVNLRNLQLHLSTNSLAS